MDALTEEVNSAKQETQRLSTAIYCLKSEAQSHKQDVTGETQQHTATIKGLKGHLAAVEESKYALSQLLESAQLKEAEVQVKLEQVQGESQEAIWEVQDLTSAMESLKQELNQERVSHSEAMTLAQDNFEKEASILEARVEESQQQYLSLQAEHANAIQELMCRLKETKLDLTRFFQNATSCKSLECDLLCLEAEHEDELLVLYSWLYESIGHADFLQAQVQAAAETIKDLKFELAATAECYDAVQVKIHGLEHMLAAAHMHIDEHDTSIQALQCEKTVLQVEHMQLEAELDRMATKHQYMEQQAKQR
jgi:chromosome segregation ATPase